jgi:hypothetical protein
LHVAREVLLDRTQVSAPHHIDTRHARHGTRHTAHDTRTTRHTRKHHDTLRRMHRESVEVANTVMAASSSRSAATLGSLGASPNEGPADSSLGSASASSPSPSRCSSAASHGVSCSPRTASNAA